MSYYMYQRPRQSTATWIRIMLIIMCITVASTGIVVYRLSSDKIASLEDAINDLKQKEVYYKEIETQFFQKKSESVTIKRYEDQLKSKDLEKEKQIQLREDEITTLSNYIEELSKQSAALENTVRKISSTSSVKPQSYTPPTKVSRGSYDRARSEGQLVPVGTWLMTMYAPTKAECGNNKGITSSGKPVQPGQNIAIDPRYWKYGQRFYIEGYGEVVATDSGSAIKGRNRLDYCVLDPKVAKQFGSKKVKVWLIKE